jgi:lipoyl(octanoyl) transferase
MPKHPSLKRHDQREVDWHLSPDLVPYDMALSKMTEHVKGIQNGSLKELVWLLEHPPLYTLGTSAKKQDFLTPSPLPVFQTGRGGQITYHGPGQRIVYLMLDLSKRCMDLKAYVWALEEWMLLTLKAFDVRAYRSQGNIGLWVKSPSHQEQKIAALGVRVQKWVTSHGIALNVHPDLSYYHNIVPCGIKDRGVTSLSELGSSVSLEEVDTVLRKTFVTVF